jgi:hypothetical protein
MQQAHLYRLRADIRRYDAQKERALTARAEGLSLPTIHQLTEDGATYPLYSFASDARDGWDLTVSVEDKDYWEQGCPMLRIYRQYQAGGKWGETEKSFCRMGAINRRTEGGSYWRFELSTPVLQFFASQKYLFGTQVLDLLMETIKAEYDANDPYFDPFLCDHLREAA